MKQYENAYPSFMFLGPTPIDFDTKLSAGECVWNDLCNFNIGNMIKRGKRHFGMIFNVDPHYKSGSHWISMFVHVKKGFIYFSTAPATTFQKRCRRWPTVSLKTRENSHRACR